MFFANGVGSSRHHVVRRNALLRFVSHTLSLILIMTPSRLSPDGDITLSERFTVSMDCEMNFEMFPFDSQACPLLLESYAYGKSGQGSMNWLLRIFDSILSAHSIKYESAHFLVP